MWNYLQAIKTNRIDDEIHEKYTAAFKDLKVYQRSSHICYKYVLPFAVLPFTVLPFTVQIDVLNPDSIKSTQAKEVGCNSVWSQHAMAILH